MLTKIARRQQSAIYQSLTVTRAKWTTRPSEIRSNAVFGSKKNTKLGSFHIRVYQARLETA